MVTCRFSTDFLGISSPRTVATLDEHRTWPGEVDAGIKALVECDASIPGNVLTGELRS